MSGSTFRSLLARAQALVAISYTSVSPDYNRYDASDLLNVFQRKPRLEDPMHWSNH